MRGTGAVHVIIDLENTGDAEVAARGLIPADKVRRYSARALVDTGAVLLVLPQDSVDHLGLRVRGKSVVTFANDLVVDPKNQTLSVRPESPIYPLYSLK